MRKAFFGFAVLSLLSACATADNGQTQEKQSQEEKVFVTGSNLPRKDKSAVTTVSGKALEDAQNKAAANGPPITAR